MLIGGTSSRMGTDKALVDIDGTTLAARVAASLRAAGAEPIAYVGGTPGQIAALGAIHVADADGVDGPAGGVLAALRWAPADEIVIAACDLVHIDPWVIPALRGALGSGAAGTAGVAIPRWDGRAQAHLSVWSTGALGRVEAAVERGERAVRRLLGDSVSWVELRGSDDLVDVDHPEDLARWTIGEPGDNG